VDDDVLCWLGFTPDAILTSCKTGRFLSVPGWLARVGTDRETGHIRTWTRPSELTQQLEEKKSA
jgi:hypothetical protein